MLNELYTPIKGTPHVVRVVNVVREFTKGEKMENTAKTQQVLAQRQKFYNFGEETFFEDNLDFEEFSMELELFLEDYEKFVEDESKKYYMLSVEICGAEELNTIKDVLQDMEAPLKDFDPINPTHYQIGGIETIDFIEAKLTPEEFKGYCKGNSIKYLSRAGYKGEERDDYKKAAWYLDKLINK